MARIGFIGLGNMGEHMAHNLLKAGHSVKVFDVVAQCVQVAKGRGGEVAVSVADAVNDADVVVTMLPAGEHVRDVYLGGHGDGNGTGAGVIATVSADTLLIDSSTIDVATAREVSCAAAGKGLLMLDAPVSGGVGGAQAGTLTFMVGGDDDAFARARPLLDVMGGNIIHAGGAGNGQAAKACNNMMLAINMIGTCEAFNLAEKLGLTGQTFFDIASTASGQSWAMTSYCPVPGPVPASPANNDYQAGFTAAMMLKDLRLAQAAASDTGAQAALGEHAEQMFTALSDLGHGTKDFSTIYRMIADEL
ncbi:MAG: 3-hydroxyisobutyrate dehydrogenase [Gammaproteobacteria bacterium]|jgi:3-hydroxyisobutyrate dehydrogenase